MSLEEIFANVRGKAFSTIEASLNSYRHLPAPSSLLASKLTV
jgi:hypothetical protein